MLLPYTYIEQNLSLKSQNFTYKNHYKKSHTIVNSALYCGIIAWAGECWYFNEVMMHTGLEKIIFVLFIVGSSAVLRAQTCGEFFSVKSFVVDLVTTDSLEGKALMKKAIIFAKKMHEGQVRKFDKMPYVTHPVRVAKKMKTITNDAELIAASYLHDIIEDTSANFKQLKYLFGLRIANIVNDLSSDKTQSKKIGKAKYLGQKLLKIPLSSLLVKLADRWDNTSDFARADPEFIANYRAETNYILSVVGRRKDLEETHISLIRDIYTAMHNGEQASTSP
ncbi:MAG: bifunctional (p)ppGpp synthetase/guanosine-3',5'-bis(diphosphate) 3'-pyrophosphohydrolase [Bdellovibrionaceae bacterium]|nr:bifunctional (p)ppGpp synthetase/guanosine-3',5'-bis(diphosphate) 3'-pyrophosphohydrolase [Pseudobdellovibrionaceae bacterium]